MQAKEYLKQIKRMDFYIDQKEKEYDRLCRQRTTVGSFDYSEERVQTSSNGSSFTKISDKLVDLQFEINVEIDKFYNIRHKIINQIQQLSKMDHVNILFKRYVEYKAFELIAAEMCLSYYRVCHLHGEALQEFEVHFFEISK